MSFDERHFQLFYGTQTSAPDGVIKDEKTPTLVDQILHSLRSMQAYLSRHSSKTALEIINNLTEEIKSKGDPEQALLASLAIIYQLLRNKVETEPSRSVASHIDEVFDKSFLSRLSDDFAALPYVTSGVDENGNLIQHVDYSSVNVFGARFTLQIEELLDEYDGESDDPDAPDSKGPDF